MRDIPTFECRICKNPARFESPYPKVCQLCYDNKLFFDKWLVEQGTRPRTSNP